MEQTKATGILKGGERFKLDAETVQKFAAFLSLILMFVFFSVATPFFLNFDNLITVALQTSVIGIMAVGVTLVIITSGIDLSLGAIIAACGVACGMFINGGMPIPLAIIAGIGVGVLFGLGSGFLISKCDLPPFIATLGMMMVARGLTLVFTEGKPIYFEAAPSFKLISQTKLFGMLPLPVIYFVIIALVTAFILQRTSIGRYIYAIGSNEEAARLSGINIKNTKLFVYGYCGALCAVAGIVLAARLNSGQPTVGTSYELDAIAAAVIGGTSLSGGEGSIMGTIIGAFIMSILKNGLNLMNVSQNWQMVAMGIVVIGAVYLDIVRKRREAKAR